MATARANDARLNRLVETVGQVTDAEGVYLFGSRARGDHSADSDYDLLVVTADPRAARALRLEIRRRLVDSGIAFDLFIVTPEVFARRADVPGTLPGIVHREGVRVDAG